MGKHHKEEAVRDVDADTEPTVPLYRSPIAKPMAGSKVSKKCLKLITEAAGHKCLCRGIKEVGKAIRKGQGDGFVF